MYQNLKITFHINNEMIIPNHPIPFEALLMKAKATQLGLILDNDNLQEIEIPIEKDEKTSLFKASVSFIESYGRNLQFYTKRYYGDIPPNIDIGRGFFKAYHIKPYTIIPPITVTFYARGILEEIKELLHYIPALGPKRSQGYGKVRKVDIEIIHEDRSFIYKNKPMRAIPITYDESKLEKWFYTQINPIPPSYTSHQTEICYFPRQNEWLKISLPSPIQKIEENQEKNKSKSKKKKISSKRNLWESLDKN